MAPRNKLQKYNASFPISRFTLHCIADEVASLSLVILCPSQHGITANIVTGASTNGDNNFPDAVFNYCNVTFAYSHNGADDQVQVWHWLPTPYTYKNRYLSTSGGAYAINSGSGLLPGGVTYGAVAGATGGGFGSFSWPEGCWDGWGQMQRFDDEWDGATMGARHSALLSSNFNISGPTSNYASEFVLRFIDMVDSSTFANTDGVTGDTLRDWILESWHKYDDSLQTTWPDLTPLHTAGGKVLHFHDLSFEDGNTALNEWYRLFFIAPATLNATVLEDNHVDENQQIASGR
ncbi:hypothetical protein V498_10724 [Pseudogymnoascus sp. VKM F-4517 (FW-2822)]|nr:hypothetical protein V498_10724 [Pseudogymnoascus sp. VKM F-4517 (FW-2822)]